MNNQEIENMAIFTNDLMKYSRVSKEYAESVFLSMTDAARAEPKEAALNFLTYFVSLGDAKPTDPNKCVEIHLSKMKETAEGMTLASSDEPADFYDLDVIEYGDLTEPHRIVESIENILNFKVAEALFTFLTNKYPNNTDACIIEA